MKTILVCLILISCGAKNDDDFNLKNVFGLDGRRNIDRDQMTSSPYRFLGRFANGCTGALVGKNLVLTALHCLIDTQNLPEEQKTEKDAKDKKIAIDVEDVPIILDPQLGFFERAMVDGNPEDIATPIAFYHLSKNPKANKHLDFAVVVLDHDISPADYLRVVDLAQDGKIVDALPANVSLIGYSGDYLFKDKEGSYLPLEQQPLTSGRSKPRHSFTASEHVGCSLQTTNKERRYVFHTCHVTGGGSGAPIFKKVGSDFRIAAIHSESFDKNEHYFSEYVLPNDEKGRKKTANIGVPADLFAALVEDVLTLQNPQDDVQSKNAAKRFKESYLLQFIPESKVSKPFPDGTWPQNWKHETFTPSLSSKNKYHSPFVTFEYFKVNPAGKYYKIVPKDNTNFTGPFVLHTINNRGIYDGQSWTGAVNSSSDGKMSVTGWDFNTKEFRKVENVQFTKNPDYKTP